jgi:hypothetical protein
MGHIKINISWFYLGLSHFLLNGKAEVFVDDKFAAELSIFQLLNIELSRGEHSLRVKIGNYATKPMTISLQDGEEREYTCKPVRPFYTLFYKPIPEPNEYLMIEPKVIKIRI